MAEFPVITINNPSDGFVANQSTVNVTGTATHSLGIDTVEIRNNGGSWQTANLLITAFDLVIDLEAGANEIDVRATATLEGTTTVETVSGTYGTEKYNHGLPYKQPIGLLLPRSGRM